MAKTLKNLDNKYLISYKDVQDLVRSCYKKNMDKIQPDFIKILPRLDIWSTKSCVDFAKLLISSWQELPKIVPRVFLRVFFRIFCKILHKILQDQILTRIWIGSCKILLRSSQYLVHIFLQDLERILLNP